MKKIMIIMFSLVLSLSMISPIYAMDSVTETEPEKVEETVEQVIVNQDTANEYTLTYSKDKKTVTGYTGTPVDVVIPKGITKIGDRAFSDCETMTSIKLPSTLVEIETRAFSNCTSLKEIELPYGVTKLGEAVFYRCVSLTSVVIPSTITAIPSRSFDWCSSLVNLTLPDNLTHIESSAFNDCNSLVSVELPMSIQSIGNSAFQGCRSLEKIVIPNGTVEGFAFYYCISLKEVTFGKNVKLAGNNIFRDCDSLTEIQLPENMSGSLEDSIFSFCDNLKSIVIPEGVTSIENYAFHSCVSLESVQLPSTLETIEDNAFYSCTALSELTIPSSVKKIGNYAFYKCGFSEFIVPEGVETIGPLSFKDNSKLKILYLPKTLKSGFPKEVNLSVLFYVYENSEAHKYCLDNNINSFRLRNGVVIPSENVNVKVGDTGNFLDYVNMDSAFSNVEMTVTSTNLDIIDLVDNGDFIAKQVGVATIIVTANGISREFFVSVSDDNITIKGRTLTSFKSTESSVVVPNGVTSIASAVFKGNTNLIQVILPNSIKSIGSEAFASCINLETVIMSDSLTTINQRAFEGCGKLKTMNLPSTVNYIDRYAFDGCKEWVAEVTIAEGMECLDSYAFRNCASLTKIVVPSTIEYINTDVFKGCTNLVLDVSKSETVYKYAVKNNMKYVAYVSSIKIDGERIINQNETVSLIASIVPYYATDAIELSWTSSNENVVIVDQKGNVTGIYSGAATITVTTENGISANYEVTVYSPVEVMTFENAYYTINRKDNVQLTFACEPFYHNSSFIWLTSDESVATVDQNGVVTGKHSGKALITVVADNGVTASCEVVVKTVELGVELNVYSLSLAKGEIYQLSSKVFPEDADQSVTWISSNPGCVKVDDNGLITAMYPGTAEITVMTSGGYTDVCEVVVTSEITEIELDRKGASIPVGKTIQLYASVTPQDRISSMNLVWTSSDTSKATVDENGVVTGKNTGQVTIRATAENGLYAESEINVISSSVTKHDYTLKLKNYIIENGEYDSELDLHYIYVEKGDHIYMICAGKYSVSFEAMYVVAEPKDKDYLFRIVEMGMTLPDYGILNSMSYVVNEAGVYSKTNKEYIYYWYSSFVPKNFKYRFEETYMSYIPLEKQTAIDMEYTEETNKAFKQWNTMIKNAIGITMNDLGFKSFNKSSGKTSILATSIDLNKNNIILDANEKYTLKATVLPAKAEDNKVTWTSSNPEVATVDSNGVVTAKEIGKTVIVAKLANGMYDYCEVSVEKQIKKITLNKSSVSLLEHETVDLVATITPSDTTQSKKITWTSSDENVATVDQNGHVVPKSLGVTTITATASNGLKATCEVSVEKHIDGITLDVTNIDMNYGDKYKLVATISPEDTTDSKKITWTSSNTNIVKVDTNGNLTPMNPGKATITAKTVNGLTATCTVNVYLQDITTTVSKAGDTSLKVSWNKVNGASGYEVYRATSIDGTYSKVTTITKGTTTSYTNSKLTNGTTYFYKVRAYRTVGKTKYYGEYSDVVGYASLKTPSITVTRNSYDSIKITWKAISKAENYEIYRSTDNKNFELIDRISDLSYVDDNLLTAKTYYYKVRAVKDCTTQEAYSSNSSVKSATTTLTVPTLNSLSDGVSTITLNWNTIDGADKYELYRATSSKGTYTLVQEFDTNEAYVDEVDYGKHYFYKIRAYHNNTDGTKGYSSYSSVLVATCINAPVVEVSRASDTSLKVSWNKVNGASGYEVYRATSIDGTYTKVTTIKKGTTTSWTDTKRTNGTTYYYKVRAYKTISKVNGYGPYSEEVGYAALKTPSITVTRNSYDSIKITWKAISKAEEYDIYRSKDNKNFELLDRISELSYVDNNLLTAKTYYYKVVAVKDCTTQEAYSSNSSVKSAITTLSTPKAKIDKVVYNRIDLAWDLVDGVDEYEVYRSTKEKGVYECIGTTSETSYEDTDVMVGTTYYYKVRGYHNNADETKGYSSYSSVVNKKVVIGTPKVVITNPDYKTIELNWDEVEGCTGYEIYRSTNAKKNFKQVATVTDGYYVDEELSTGTTYYYQIRSYREYEDGSKKYSSYTTVNKKVELKVPSNLVVDRISGSEAYITFDEVYGADGYEIYRATSLKGKYTKVATVTECEYTNSKLSSKSTYYYKVRAYHMIGKTKVYSGYTSVFTCKK